MLSTRFRGVDLAREKTPPMLCGPLTRKMAPLRPTVSPVDSEENKNAGSRGSGGSCGRQDGRGDAVTDSENRGAFEAQEIYLHSTSTDHRGGVAVCQPSHAERRTTSAAAC
ncbi:hypothetical protein GH5_02509 [Leishmania sp. Ghana 2012 LV757]|uniref:hypothetical protein n=1 Tax=Leishmania sp. Ghana 2012 LV757 TaxID=2803181 RepID=UPI001B3CD9DC|nr:hypothetical protein GH5_02509 [Leishmania sp. Ghana 2012 LV757]